MTETKTKPVAIDTTAVDETTVATFVSAFHARTASFLIEATAYVASVDARGGKRGADAAVQRLIADGLPKGAEPYSPTRYSKLSAAFRALPIAGFKVTDAAGFDALYALWNLPSNKLDSQARDLIVKGAARRKSDEARLTHLWDAIAAVKAGKVTPEPEPETPAEETPEESAPAEETAPAPIDIDTLLTVVKALAGAAVDLSEADRVTLADAMQETVDAIWETVSAPVAESVAA